MDKSIGQLIREARKERHLTQRELALESGISLSALQRYETDERCPQLDVIEKLATALSCDKFELIGFNPIAIPDAVPDDKEKEILAAYRDADDRARADALTLLRAHSNQ